MCPTNYDSASPIDAPTFEQILTLHVPRRQVLQVLGVAALSLRAPGLRSAATESVYPGSSLGFKELRRGLDEQLHVPAGYRAQVVIRWGDPVLPNAPAFDPTRQTADAQQLQFGYNNDYLAFLPVAVGGVASGRGVLVVNHEYTNPRLMFPRSPAYHQLSAEQTAVDIMAHGMSIVEIRQNAGGWKRVPESRVSRRITPLTRMRFSGPAAGHDRMRTVYSRHGLQTQGTFANCAGGVTPWGTVLTAEENVQQYFYGDIRGLAEEENYRRFGFRPVTLELNWGRYYHQWNLAENPNAPLHAGWIVEVDPYDSMSTPVKRTALGRCRHEGCGVWRNQDGRIVCYMGDDQEYEYIYRFVTRNRYRPDNRAANFDLLDEGELSVAEFTPDGKLVWHPLVYGLGPLVKNNGFNNQGDVVIDLRKAADLMNATRMDRPEGMEVNPVTGTVFVMLTGNAMRQRAEQDAANPRSRNHFGHVLELTPPGGDHSASIYDWELFILAGDPNTAPHRAQYHEGTTEHGWLVNPDNCTFDNRGRLWMTTDGANVLGFADGIWACDVFGAGRALTRHFLRAPIGGEVSGPRFSPDNATLFCSIQHPAEGSTFDFPATRWPDFRSNHPPRPAVVAIARRDGGVVGS